MSSRDEAAVRSPLTDGHPGGRYAVALCTYNGSRYVAEQLRTILDARPAPTEVVIVDDASRDDTLEVVAASLRGWVGQVTITVNPTNIGSLRSFERAIGMTTQPIVFLADQDDAWHPEKPARMLDAFAARPGLLLLHSDARIVDDDGVPFGYNVLDAIEASAEERATIHRGRAFDAFVRRNFATGATIAFRRSLLDVALPIPDEWVHDEWLATVAAAVGDVDFLDAPLIDYRQHANNQIGGRRLTLRGKVDRALNKPDDFYERQVRRAAALLERLTALGARVPREHLAKLQRKLSHLETRAVLPKNRVARAVPIAREWWSGGYRLYSNGMKSIVRDLFYRP